MYILLKQKVFIYLESYSSVMGYGDARVKKSRVYTRIINSELEKFNSMKQLLYGEELGLRWKLRLGFDSSW